ncbi:hypothetical protein GXW74_26805 [Roseomonas eburnea]|uniref:Uncharacterized protein n=1 Tax=Neoroseomonas eburnea TaxID=1346889 RepID=A0A9X9XK67_9PROT|nr:hypothetical protein [Neoroseomonas eburnea]MBR0684103.1 hypothetical protein [Neoroseomonas eburnea]
MAAIQQSPAARRTPQATEGVSRQAIEAMTDAERDGLGYFSVMAALNPHPAAGVTMFRYLVERNLRQLGYSSAELRPMQERPFREAVRSYQRQIGAEPNGTLTLAQGERLLRVRNILSESRITAGPMMMVSGENHLIASGTWTVLDGQAEHPVNRSHLTCSRPQSQCVEAAARVVLRDAETGGSLASDLLTYRIVAWSPGEIRAEIEHRCVTRVLVLRTFTSEISLLDRPHPVAECRLDAGLSPGIMVLRHGAEPIAQYYDERRAAAAGDLSPELRNFLNRAVAGPPEAPTVASWR